MVLVGCRLVLDLVRETLHSVGAGLGVAGGGGRGAGLGGRGAPPAGELLVERLEGVRVGGIQDASVGVADAADAGRPVDRGIVSVEGLVRQVRVRAGRQESVSVALAYHQAL